jgi:hypothetical protein
MLTTNSALMQTPNSQLLIILIHQPTIVLPAFQPAYNKNDKGKLREIF